MSIRGPAHLILLAAACLAAWPACAQITRVELALADKLDDERGFCVDVVGSQARARPDAGVQAHTCYSYQGRIAVDQAFDAAHLRAGTLYMPAFDVCLHGEGKGPAALSLRACDGSAAQRYAVTPEGRILSVADRALCLTVAAGMSRIGAGGRPPHLIRSLWLAPCSGQAGRYQTWIAREAPDYVPSRR
jgi:hypothetical protein